MSQQVVLGVIALLAGAVVGVLAFVPFVAVTYRRHGRVTPLRLITAFAVLVYFLAIWTYTLLPLPDPAQIVCTTPQLNPFAFVGDVRLAVSRSGSPLTDPAILQLVLNIVLFIPLGFFVRILARRGILVIAVTGFALSLLIETTQVTGVWGLYPCAYRLFDVDDLLTNTLGAVLGGLLALAIPAKYRVRGMERIASASVAAPVTARRRLHGMLCDALSALLIGLVAGIAVQLIAFAVGGKDAVTQNDAWVDAATILVPIVVTFTVLVSTGRTIGNAAVQLEYSSSPFPTLVARLLRYLGGIGGFLLLGLLPAELSGWLTLAFVVGSVVLVFTTRGNRGLPGILSRQGLVDSRPSGPSGSAVSTPDHSAT